MVDKEKAAREYAEAVKSMDNSVETDISGMQRQSREAELSRWSEEQARSLANEEGIELTERHLEVVHTLRNYYLEHGEVTSGRELSEMLDQVFADKGGKKYLHSLFPEGPVQQGMHIAGLPVPAHTEDSGFGIAR
jgi:TusE/DsrC/DsvC family sulfur relay protein